MRRILPLALALALAACGLFGPRPPSYLVFFTERSATLDAPARGVIAEAAKQAVSRPGAPVLVLGYTDSAGSPDADKVLSDQRAAAVAAALVADGVAADRIKRQGRGQTGEDPGVASRRVEIQLAGT